MLYEFLCLSDIFTFGKYRYLSLSDVIERDSGYLYWCMCIKQFDNLYISDECMQELKSVYPLFVITPDFEKQRVFNIQKNDYYESDDNDDLYDREECYPKMTYDRYNGTYAQDSAYMSDYEIDVVLDGDPMAYWNID